MKQNIKYYLKKLFSKLWFRPLLFCIFSVGIALLAHMADDSFIVDIAPKVNRDSLADLLNTLSGSMLVIAIFAVGSMISAFSAASGTATPRSFKLIVADDVSQYALSVYIGSFIFGIVASVALKNGYYGSAGYFTLFVVTLIVFALVIVTFLKWVERISKLGRLGHTISTVEEAAKKAFLQRLKEPFLGGYFISDVKETGTPICTEKVGYVQYIDMKKLQELAKKNNATLVIKCLPGSFCTANKPLAYLQFFDNQLRNFDTEEISKHFKIEDSRSFSDDPRFGIITLSEIASRALSPGINDPGTAISIVNSYARLFTLWIKEQQSEKKAKVKYDRIIVPTLLLDDLFDDAFRPIARDGASNIEVMLRIQKVLSSLASIGSFEVKKLAIAHSKLAFERAEIEMKFKHDLDLLRKESLFNTI